MPLNFWRHCGEVLAAFCIPFGGGIPAGVILADNAKLGLGVTLILYFISDILLALAFEPLMRLFIRRTKDSEFMKRFIAQYKITLERLGFHAGLSPNWYSLVVLSFGVDPMTSRVIAHAAGYGFFSGWAFAICGDMIFFAIIMISTLWLNNILGNGTIAAAIVMIAMFAIPPLIRKLKSRLSSPKP